MVVAIGFFIIGSPRYVHIPSKDRIISTLLHLLKQSARTSRNGTIVVTGEALSYVAASTVLVAAAKSVSRMRTARVRCDKDAIEDILSFGCVDLLREVERVILLPASPASLLAQVQLRRIGWIPLPKTLLPHTPAVDQQELLERLPVLLR
uniref:Uncharacterized protein n=1 Tax=Phytophthora fragariae TaxID=53985 RepID=A0A6A3EEV4_9STRA|nr:hypothetical protein PF009_g18828 [Phytophthora fragariae]